MLYQIRKQGTRDTKILLYIEPHHMCFYYWHVISLKRSKANELILFIFFFLCASKGSKTHMCYIIFTLNKTMYMTFCCMNTWNNIIQKEGTSVKSGSLWSWKVLSSPSHCNFALLSNTSFDYDHGIMHCLYSIFIIDMRRNNVTVK